MFDPVQTPPEPHYPPKLNTKYSNFKIQFSKFDFQNSNFQNSIVQKNLTFVSPGKRQLKHRPCNA